MTTKIERSETTGIKVTGIDGDYCMSRSVEANVLFAILEKLEEIRCGLIDIETNIDSH